ncbi:hypothetical protein TNCV_3185381 [Trichonephila clavipes]|nr:hypothetical protein TNCV_3185381 [Trichonephila clavipes]
MRKDLLLRYVEPRAAGLINLKLGQKAKTSPQLEPQFSNFYTSREDFELPEIKPASTTLHGEVSEAERFEII